MEGIGFLMKSWLKKIVRDITGITKRESSSITCQLDNVYERNKESPYTFYKPSEEVINSLEVGDLVKLIFFVESDEDGYRGERMWVEIIERNGNDFVGKLENKPYRLKDLNRGQEINFRPEHICETEYEDEESTKLDYYFNTLITVSIDVLDKNEFNFLLRDQPSDDSDSGWVVLSGYEEEEFSNNPDNFQIVALGVMLNIDDSILSFINEQPLCAYERNENGQFEKIEDYDWEGYVNE